MPRYVPAVGVRGFTLTGALRIKQGENENDAIRNRISDFDKRKGPGTLTSLARHPRTAGEWTGVFSTEVDWVKNR